MTSAPGLDGRSRQSGQSGGSGSHFSPDLHPRGHDGRFRNRAVADPGGGLNALPEQEGCDTNHFTSHPDTEAADQVAYTLACMGRENPQRTMKAVARILTKMTGRPDPTVDTVEDVEAVHRLFRSRQNSGSRGSTPDSDYLDAIYLILATNDKWDSTHEAVTRALIHRTGRPHTELGSPFDTYASDLEEWRAQAGDDSGVELADRSPHREG